MLSGSNFYWGTIRKSIVAFGNMFNDIYVDRKTDEGTQQSLLVPLSYSPRQKFLARIDQYPSGDGEQNFQVSLPRMSFEMLQIDYDPTRKVNVLHQNRSPSTVPGTIKTQYSQVPYNLSMALYAYTKNQDDGLQIVEQILPYFNPDFNLTVNAVPEMDLKFDLPVLLNSVSYEDTYEGDFRDRRAIIWTFMFTLKLNFFGPTSNSGFIRRTHANIFSNISMTNLTAEIEVTTDPGNVNPGNAFVFVETIREFD